MENWALVYQGEGGNMTSWNSKPRENVMYIITRKIMACKKSCWSESAELRCWRVKAFLCSEKHNEQIG